MERGTRLLVGGVLAAVLTWPLAETIDVAAVGRELGTADPAAVVAGAVLGLLAVAAGGETNRRLLAAVGNWVSPGRFALAYGSVTFARSLLPLGNAATPAIVAYAISAETGREYEVGLATATVSELLQSGASIVLALAAVPLLAASGAGAEPSTRMVVVGALAVAVLVVGVVTVGWYRRGLVTYAVVAVGALVRGTAGRVSERVRQRTQREELRARLRRFYRSLDVVAADRRTLATAFGVALLGWVALGGALAACLGAVGATALLGVVLLVPPVGAMANAFPTPGGLGAVEVTLTGLLSALAGIGLERAAAVALLFRLCTYWAPAVVGGVCTAVLWARGRTSALDVDTETLPAVD